MEALLIIVGGIALLIFVSTVAQRLGIVAPLLLLLAGIGIGYIPGVPPVILNPEIILIGILPPLLYGAAVNLPLTDLRRNGRPIFGLSFLLVVITALIVGFALNFFVPQIPLAAAIALGAVVAPPDAVAATAIGKRVGLPPRLVHILEGESLLNDATSLVLLRTSVAAIAGAFYFWGAVANFAYSVAAATLIGFVVGFVTVWIRKRLTNPVHDTAISFIVPFLAFIPAEEVGASGVLAVVIAGLYTGHNASRTLSAPARLNERLNWHTIQFLLENGVFLVMGLEMHTLVVDVRSQTLSLGHVSLIAVSIFLLLIAIRFVGVFALVFNMRRSQVRYEKRRSGAAKVKNKHIEHFDPDDADTKEIRLIDKLDRYQRRANADLAHAREEGLGWRGAVILGWSGMRGVVTLAAAQTLPHETPYRSQIILIAFAVAILSLLVHGFTLPPLVAALKPTGPSKGKQAQELIALHDDLLQQALHAIDSTAAFEGSKYSTTVIAKAKTNVTQALAPLKIMGAQNTPETALTEAELGAELSITAIEALRNALIDSRSIGEYSSRALGMAQTTLDAYEVRFRL